MLSYLKAYCQGEFKRIDFASKLYENEEQVYWRFGKHKDQLVSETKSYCNWVLSSDFPSETKTQIRKILEK